MVEILPSILSADFARLGEQVEALESAGCRMLHVDVMDGHFVPNITIGPPVVASLRKITRLTLDVHLMISDPDRYAPMFIEAGADQVSVHQETCPHLDRTLRMIRGEGARAGVVINPSTPVAALDEVLEIADYVLIMSVNPGFGGQEFIPYALDKVRRLSARKRERGLRFPIEIDGGVTKDNVAEIVRAGGEWVVAGSSIFHGGKPAAAFEEMRQHARSGEAVRA
jgi:ribulose-phosphate 3-epimerase